jgi:hypothetical protein
MLIGAVIKQREITEPEKLRIFAHHEGDEPCP